MVLFKAKRVIYKSHDKIGFVSLDDGSSFNRVVCWNLKMAATCPSSHRYHIWSNIRFCNSSPLALLLYVVPGKTVKAILRVESLPNSITPNVYYFFHFISSYFSSSISSKFKEIYSGMVRFQKLILSSFQSPLWPLFEP